MIDREKVIKGLETCEISGTLEDCEGYGCPYSIYNDEVSDECQVHLFKDALALLKTQEPPTSKSISSAIECLLHQQDADDSDMAKAIETAVRAMRLLKVQEPRLVTEADFANADECGYITAWCEASNGLFAECITIRALQETDFRYWTSRPTEEMMEATPWPD